MEASDKVIKNGWDVFLQHRVIDRESAYKTIIFESGTKKRTHPILAELITNTLQKEYRVKNGSPVPRSHEAWITGTIEAVERTPIDIVEKRALAAVNKLSKYRCAQYK